MEPGQTRYLGQEVTPEFAAIETSKSAVRDCEDVSFCWAQDTPHLPDGVYLRGGYRGWRSGRKRELPNHIDPL